jgi:hypothetical protein
MSDILMSVVVDVKMLRAAALHPRTERDASASPEGCAEKEERHGHLSSVM